VQAHLLHCGRAERTCLSVTCHTKALNRLQVHLADKGKAAAIVCGIHTTTDAGKPVAYSEFTTFALGAGTLLQLHGTALCLPVLSCRTIASGHVVGPRDGP
jgi:hypothetical protein